MYRLSPSALALCCCELQVPFAPSTAENALFPRPMLLFRPLYANVATPFFFFPPSLDSFQTFLSAPLLCPSLLIFVGRASSHRCFPFSFSSLPFLNWSALHLSAFVSLTCTSLISKASHLVSRFCPCGGYHKPLVFHPFRWLSPPRFPVHIDPVCLFSTALWFFHCPPGSKLSSINPCLFPRVSCPNALRLASCLLVSHLFFFVGPRLHCSPRSPH